MKRSANRLVAACAAVLVSVACSPVCGGDMLRLESPSLGLCFDSGSGTFRAVSNKLSGETYHIAGDQFSVETTDFRVDFRDVRLVSVRAGAGRVECAYAHDRLGVEVAYTLDARRHFAEKRVKLTFKQRCGVKQIIVGAPSFSGVDLQVVAYRYPKFMREPGTEPICTFFGRTAQGGFFTGVEMPFDASTTSRKQVVLGYRPSLKVAAGEKLACEPVYFGVYRRGPDDREEKGLPLKAESDAMVAMTSAILGPPRHGLVPMACGWGSEMSHVTFRSVQDVEADMKSLDFLAQCGVDWLSDSHPWGGETEKMNSLRDDQPYRLGDLYRRFLEHARHAGVNVTMWGTLNNSHPWGNGGRPFRADKPEWLMTIAKENYRTNPIILGAKGNCLANRPFDDWLTRVNLEGLATGYYPSWVIDGDFFGAGGWYTSVVPVTCTSDQHDHLPGDSNYGCQRALQGLIDTVRRHYPKTYIFMCRPPMDLGVWSLRNVDACFTLLEAGTADNLTAGDQIRRWSRTRVHRDFFPHYLDQPLLFPSREDGRGKPPNWPNGHLDYVLLSALSSSPNQLYYLPTKSGIPDKDKTEIRQWLDWGRKHVEYLKVRKDLTDWPAPGKVDGSAHVIGDRGLVFLFNPGRKPLDGQFALAEQSIGLRGPGPFRVRQVYPPSHRSIQLAFAETVRWPVPEQTAVVLDIEPTR